MRANFLKDIVSLEKDPLTGLPDSISQPKATIGIVKRFGNENSPGDKDSENTTASSKLSEKLDLNLFQIQEFPVPDSSFTLVRLENGGLVENLLEEEVHIQEPHGLLAPGSIISEPEPFATSGSKWSQPGGLGSPVTITYSYSNLLDGTIALSAPQLTSAIEEAMIVSLIKNLAQSAYLENISRISEAFEQYEQHRRPLVTLVQDAVLAKTILWSPQKWEDYNHSIYGRGVE
ncbi:MAG: hypothetical protein GDA44_11135 [Prochloron sp. SP5CPC1]|nr:hypothetical protein [Candidatus Paraprochloron terpiosi SP5CPC1]